MTAPKHTDATRAALAKMASPAAPPKHTDDTRAALARLNRASKIVVPEFKTPPIYTGSISRLHDYEKCPFMAFLKHVERVELTPEQRERLQYYADRGTRIHTAAEHYVDKTRDDVAPELKHFATELGYLRALHSKGKVTNEGEWALDRNWQPTEWKGKNTWIRMKLDAFVRLAPSELLVVDYKSGKKFGNEVKHNEQGQLYAIGANAYYPKTTTTHVEFWYTDQDDMSQVEYSTRHLDQFKRTLGVRFHRLTTAVQFPPKPNIFNCQYCSFNVNGTGHCDRGIVEIAPPPSNRRKPK